MGLLSIQTQPLKMKIKPKKEVLPPPVKEPVQDAVLQAEIREANMEFGMTVSRMSAGSDRRSSEAREWAEGEGYDSIPYYYEEREKDPYSNRDDPDDLPRFVIRTCTFILINNSEHYASPRTYWRATMDEPCMSDLPPSYY